MSFTIPMISFEWRLSEISLMSVKLSRRTLTVENFEVSAMQNTDQITTASAIKGELMKLFTQSTSMIVFHPISTVTFPNHMPLTINILLYMLKYLLIFFLIQLFDFKTLIYLQYCNLSLFIHIQLIFLFFDIIHIHIQLN